MNTRIVIIIAVVVLLLLTWYLYFMPRDQVVTGEAVIDGNTTINGNYTIETGGKVSVRNGATLTVRGDLDLKGELDCTAGPVLLEVEGNVDVSGAISCIRSEQADENSPGRGISILAHGDISFGANSVVTTNGHIQIVDTEANLAKTREQLDDLFEEAGRDGGEGNRLGPFVDAQQTASQTAAPESLRPQTTGSTRKARNSLINLFIPAAAAQVGNTWTFRGTVRIPTPRRGVRRIILFWSATTPNLRFRNYNLTGPDGRNGLSEIGQNCNAVGKKGENAFRMYARASNIQVDHFTIKLGDGGRGGHAETQRDCADAKAKAGDGGKSGNLKIIAGNNFQITGAFNVKPGRGGHGGDAAANGKDGAAGEDGGKATATGGNGSNSRKVLRISGTVTGVSNISVGDVVAGNGGKAEAYPGMGGDGAGCRDEGGAGGAGAATGGDGGDASVRLTPPMSLAPGAVVQGGNGGDAVANGGNGGVGGHCGPEGRGGKGGDGGDATPKHGAEGTGVIAGNPGVDTEQAGNGGDGGDGCPPGGGGTAGVGQTLGNNGVDGAEGRNLCIIDEQRPQ